MKKLMLAAVGLTGILASCGSFGTAPDGSGSARVVGISTEYTQAGVSPTKYVGCDQVFDGAVLTSNKTQVVVRFAAAGTITKVDVMLKGTTNNDFDVSQTITANSFSKDANGDYVVVFDFDAANGNYLPAGIIVNPNDPIRTPQQVGTSDPQGSFYADLKVYTSTGASFTITSANLGSNTGKINVYRTCSLNPV